MNCNNQSFHFGLGMNMIPHMIRAVICDARGTKFDAHSVSPVTEQLDRLPAATRRRPRDVASFVNLSNRRIANSKE